jgi:hypothetical protein
MSLNDITREQKEAMCLYRAENHTIQESVDWLYETYPDAAEYSRTTIKLWFNSKEGKKIYNLALEQVRGDARVREYANKESRILALVEVVGKIHHALRDMDPRNDAKFPQLFREFREGLSSLRAETDDGYGTERAMDAFTATMKEIGSGQFKWAVKHHSPQILETPDN